VQELYIPFPASNVTTANPVKDGPWVLLAAANQKQVVTKLGLLTVLVQCSFSDCSVLAQ